MHVLLTLSMALYYYILVWVSARATQNTALDLSSFVEKGRAILLRHVVFTFNCLWPRCQKLLIDLVKEVSFQSDFLAFSFIRKFYNL